MSSVGQKGVMSIVYGAIVVAIMLVFIIQFRPNSGQRTGSLQQQCVVTVRGQCLDPKDFWASYQLMVPRGDSDSKQAGLRYLVAQGLLERTLLVQDAERLKIMISEAAINEEIRRGRIHVSLPVDHAQSLLQLRTMSEPGVVQLAFGTNGGRNFDYKTYQRVIKQATNRSEKEFKAMQRDELLAERMRDLIRSRARVTEEEGFALYAEEHASATLDFIALHRPFFLRHFVDSSPNVVSGWADAHKQEIDSTWESQKSNFTPGCRLTRHILIKTRNDRQPEGHEKEEAAQLIAKAMDRIKSGEDFAHVAEEVSEDDSGERGGEVGCLKKGGGRFAKPFEDAVFALAKPGDIDSKVESESGLHIVQVKEIISDDPQKAEADGRRLLAKDMMEKFTADQMMSEAGKDIMKAAQEGKSLQQATDDVITALQAKWSSGKKGDKAKPAADKKENILEDKHAPKVEATRPFGLSDRPIAGASVTSNVASMAFKLEKPGQVGGDLVRLSDGYAVIQLKEKTSATREGFEKSKDLYMGMLKGRKGEQLLSEYIARLRQAAKAETMLNEQFTKDPVKDQQSGEED